MFALRNTAQIYRLLVLNGGGSMWWVPRGMEPFLTSPRSGPVSTAHAYTFERIFHQGMLV